MDRQTQELLEFHKIREELLSTALSEEGRTLVKYQDFFKDSGGLKEFLDRACEFRILLEASEGLPGLFFPPLDFLVRINKEGSVLEGEEAAALGRYIRSAEVLRRYLKNPPKTREDYTGILAAEAGEIPDLTLIEKEIFQNVDEQGLILENHPAIRPIRRNMERLSREIREMSFQYLQNHHEIWQNELPTIRDGRTVLPLKANYRGRIKGIVHETSSRGATVFIEPFDVLEKNNQLAMQENRLHQEELKILRDLTVKIRPSFGQCRELSEKVAFIDACYVRARYARSHDCTRPEILDRGLRLKDARHPSLGSQAVPITLTMSDDTDILIITGPNTGGKTVSLKTAGLLILMHQFGMEIPAAQGSGLSLFSGVYADIGDDQSIEASLSTFSGHMTRHAFIMEASDSRSLVLLDELGGGTDPQEGAALAMAILDWFACRKIPVITTTHLGVMKNYGYTRKGAMNASVTFDDNTLRPTYHILEGIPGESHALEIAGASGVPGEIIQAAHTYLDEEKTDISEMIRELQDSRRRLHEEEKQLKDSQKAVNEARREVDLKDLRLRRKEAEIRSGEFGELKRYVRESRRRLENLVAELKTGEVTREQTREVRAFVEELTRREKEEEAFEEERETLLEGEIAAEIPSNESAGELLPGADVLVGEHRRAGTLVRKERSGQWLVAVGTMKVTVRERDLIPAGKSGKNKSTYRVSLEKRAGGHYASMELDLRGMRAEEALRALEQQIDLCLLSGLLTFSVIHGLGEGILQKAVQDYLSSCPSVKSFHFAHPDQGGYGKTEVEL